MIILGYIFLFIRIEPSLILLINWLDRRFESYRVHQFFGDAPSVDLFKR
jgi:hypothetical protein